MHVCSCLWAAHAVVDRGVVLLLSEVCALQDVHMPWYIRPLLPLFYMREALAEGPGGARSWGYSGWTDACQPARRF
jgi:hypothetical protein